MNLRKHILISKGIGGSFVGRFTINLKQATARSVGRAVASRSAKPSMMIWEIRSIKKNGLTMFFYYDSAGNPIAFSYNGCMHYYVKNLQGDIVRVVNEAGNTVASYEYDAWGKLLAAKNYYGVPVTDPNSIALVNPLRYRGYVYDDETGLYYLKSRYYDPTTCRFLNADNIDYLANGEQIFNTNLFTYCNNNFRESDYNGKYSSYFSSKTYNRNNALNYARLNYYRKQETSMFRYYGGRGGDCANFVSQCLYFGGIKMSNGWFFEKIPFGHDKWTASWVSAPDQYKYFRLWGFTKYIITIDREDYFDRHCLKAMITHYGIKGGDLMYMDFDGDGKIDHATMITGYSWGTELYFTAHSDPKYGFPVKYVFYDKNNRRWKHPNMILKIVVLL